jgi:hypothetical protein
MSTSLLVILSVVVIIIFASQVAGRLDKLHRRVSSARTTLWRRCNERYDAAIQFGDTEIAQLAQQLRKAAANQMFSAEHLLLESRLTRMLQQDVQPVSLQSAQLRLQDSRRMYNEAVRATIYLRSWRISRWLKLSGRATLPKYVDFNDDQLNP